MDETVWHKCVMPMWAAVRSLPGPDGKRFWIGRGQLWRRRVNGRWEYQQDEQALEDWLDQQW